MPCVTRMSSSSSIRHGSLNWRTLKEFVSYEGCYMKFIAEELDAPDTKSRCGICAYCRGRQFITLADDNPYLAAARDYKNQLHGIIQPRKRWSDNKKIDEALQYEAGWTYTVDAYSPIGRRFMLERDNGHYSDKTMTTISQFLVNISKKTESTQSSLSRASDGRTSYRNWRVISLQRTTLITSMH